MTKMLKISVAILIVGVSAFWFGLPDLRDALIVQMKRLSAPALMLPPAEMKPHPQNQWIESYRNLGYDLQCNGNPGPQERVSADDDTICTAIIKTYEGMPADTVAFLFHKNELQHIRIALPATAMEPLQTYLEHTFSGIHRLDHLPGAEVFGKNVKVWPVSEGVVIAPMAAALDQPVTLIWTSKTSLLRDLEAKTSRALQELQKLREKAQAEPVPPKSAEAVAPTPKIEQSPLPSAEPTKPVLNKRGNARHTASPDADLRKCLDMSTDRDIARCAAH